MVSNAYIMAHGAARVYHPEDDISNISRPGASLLEKSAAETAPSSDNFQNRLKIGRKIA